MTGQIKMGKTKSFEDLVREKLEEKTVKTASADEEVKTAELSEGQKKLPQALQDAIEKKQDGGKKDDKDEKKKEECPEKDEKKDCEAAAEVEEKVAEKEEADTSGQPQAEAKLVNTPEKENKGTTGKADNEEAEGSGQLEVEPLHQKGREASETESFVKLAKLDGKTREFLKKFWGNLYPADYVDAMLAEY